jgi:hypothetical protein
MMYGIVDEAQAAFIHGRYILDNVLEAHEIIHFATKKKKIVNNQVSFGEYILIKPMIESAGLFLKELLFRLCIVWTNWIENLLVMAQICINLNSNLTQYFK